MAAPAGFINPKDAPYNAAGNGSSDDTTALNAAASDCAAQGKDLWIPYSGGDPYRITDTLIIPAGVNVESWALIDYDGPSNRPGVVVGTSGQHNDGVSVTLWVNCSATDWDNSDYVAVRILNARASWFLILRAGNETYAGIDCRAEGGFDCEGNLIECGQITSPRYSAHMDSRGTTGRCRDNVLVGGRTSKFSGHPDRENSFWWLGSTDGTAPGGTRNNFWWVPSCEGGAASNDTCQMIVEGKYNEMWQSRDEWDSGSNSKWIIADGSAAECNMIYEGHRQSSLGPTEILLRNGAPSGRHSYWRKRQRFDGGSDDEIKIGAQR